MWLINDKKKIAFYFLQIPFCILLLSACGSGKTNSATGNGNVGSEAGSSSISFNLKWEHPSQGVVAGELNRSSYYTPLDAASIDICVDYGISTVSGTVYNSSNAQVASGSSSCSAHQGTISNIPADSNMKLVVDATVSGAVNWRAEKTGITCYAGQTTNVGTIIMTYIGSDTTPPTVSSTTPSNDATNVPVTTSITATFSEKMASSTIDTSTFRLKAGTTSISGTVTYNSSTNTAQFVASSALAYSTNFTATVTTGVTDMAANAMASNLTWSFTTERPPGIVPSAPTGVTATSGDRQITISWDPVSGATSFNIYWSLTSGVTKDTGTKIANVTSPYTHTGRTNGTSYFYVITAVNSYGESRESSQAYAAAEAPPLSLPSIPSGVTATAASSSQIDLSWTASTGTVTGYKVYRNGSYLKSATSPSASDTGLSSSTNYCYYVTAYNSAGESGQSSQACAMTQAAPLSPLSTPTGLTATAASSFQINLSWIASTGTVTGYKVYKNGVYLKTVSTTSTSDTGLSPSTNYCYYVTAYNSAGESGQSSQVCATTTASASAITLAMLDDPREIIVRNNYILIVDRGASCTAGKIWKVPINGGETIALASNLYFPTNISADNEYVYWTEGGSSYCSSNTDGTGSVKKVPINKGEISTLTDGLYVPSSVAVYNGNVYWTEYRGYSGGSLKKVSINGGGVIILKDTLVNPRGLAVANNFIYFAEDADVSRELIKKVSLTTNDSWTIANESGISCGFAATEGSSVYWTSHATGGISTSAVKKVPIDGGVVTNLATGSEARGIAADEQNVYWADMNDGVIKKVATNGGIPNTIVPCCDYPYPWGLAIDDTFVYFTYLGHTRGGVVKVPKQ